MHAQLVNVICDIQKSIISVLLGLGDKLGSSFAILIASIIIISSMSGVEENSE